MRQVRVLRIVRENQRTTRRRRSLRERPQLRPVCGKPPNRCSACLEKAAPVRGVWQGLDPLLFQPLCPGDIRAARRMGVNSVKIAFRSMGRSAPATIRKKRGSATTEPIARTSCLPGLVLDRSGLTTRPLQRGIGSCRTLGPSFCSLADRQSVVVSVHRVLGLHR
jgi:hypothetical protein